MYFLFLSYFLFFLNERQKLKVDDRITSQGLCTESKLTFLAFESCNCATAGLTWTQCVKHFVRNWLELGV